MADKISRIKSKWLVLQLKPSRLYLQALMVGLYVLTANICCVQTATCPPSVPASAAIISEQCNFAGYTTTQTYGVATGQVSKSLYYMYTISSPQIAGVRKVDASGSQSWMTSFAFFPIVKCLSVDVAEQSVYFARQINPIVVLKLAASDGSIVSQHQL